MAMTIEEVVEWLGTIKLSKYAEIFRDEDINGALLATCTPHTLEEIGIKSDLHRKKIFLRFRDIK